MNIKTFHIGNGEFIEWVEKGWYAPFQDRDNLIFWTPLFVKNYNDNYKASEKAREEKLGTPKYFDKEPVKV